MLVTHAKAAPLVIAGENWVHTRPLNPSLKTEDYEAQPNPNSNPRSKSKRRIRLFRSQCTGMQMRHNPSEIAIGATIQSQSPGLIAIIAIAIGMNSVISIINGIPWWVLSSNFQFFRADKPRFAYEINYVLSKAI